MCNGLTIAGADSRLILSGSSGGRLLLSIVAVAARAHSAHMQLPGQVKFEVAISRLQMILYGEW